MATPASLLVVVADLPLSLRNFPAFRPLLYSSGRGIRDRDPALPKHGRKREKYSSKKRKDKMADVLA